MELLTLLFLYLLTQNPDFPKKIQPLCQGLKNSEDILRFLKDLSAFSDLFSKKEEKKEDVRKEDKKSPSDSPTGGIADGFIENFLKDYLK